MQDSPKAWTPDRRCTRVQQSSIEILPAAIVLLPASKPCADANDTCALEAACPVRPSSNSLQCQPNVVSGSRPVAVLSMHGYSPCLHEWARQKLEHSLPHQQPQARGKDTPVAADSHVWMGAPHSRPSWTCSPSLRACSFCCFGMTCTDGSELVAFHARRRESCFSRQYHVRAIGVTWLCAMA